MTPDKAMGWWFSDTGKGMDLGCFMDELLLVLVEILTVLFYFSIKSILHLACVQVSYHVN